MAITLQQGDLTTSDADAIVNAANTSLLGGGGVDGAIHRTAGPGLLEECRTLGGARTGEVKATRGYDLPARFVLHAVGPVWNGGDRGEADLLAGCHRRAIALGAEHGCEVVAFPAISTGVYGYPAQLAAPVALAATRAALAEQDVVREARFVLFSADALAMWRSALVALDPPA